jgi:hypothetical protein
MECRSSWAMPIVFQNKIKCKESATKGNTCYIYVLFVQKKKYFLKGEKGTMAMILPRKKLLIMAMNFSNCLFIVVPLPFWP